MPLSHIFVSKHRKVIFTSNLVIQDITNIPLVSGSYFVKWRLKNGEPSAGQTDKLQIKDHGVVWNEYITTSTEIIINKHHVLSPCDWKLEIYQEQPGVGSVPIGSLLINLSEYATSGPITKRFLLDECKFNSFIKIAIQMTQVAGSEEYTVPPMVKAQRLPDNPMATCNNHGPDAQDDPSAASLSGSFTERAMPPRHTTGVTKSQSVASLPQYCRNNPSFLHSDDPTPSDLVEQLFTQ